MSTKSRGYKSIKPSEVEALPRKKPCPKLFNNKDVLDKVRQDDSEPSQTKKLQATKAISSLSFSDSCQIARNNNPPQHLTGISSKQMMHPAT